MEVIARKRGGLIGLYIFCMVFGLLIFAISVAGIIFSENISFMLLAIMGAVIGIMGLVITIQIAKTPQEIVVYKDGKLYCGGVEFLPSEIKNVEYRRAHAKGLSYGWGKIKIILEYRVLSFNYVAEVEQVHNRLIQIMLKNY